MNIHQFNRKQFEFCIFFCEFLMNFFPDFAPNSRK